MIKLVEGFDKSIEDFIYSFGHENIYLAAYRQSKAMYIQETENGLTAAMLPSDSAFYLLGAEGADIDELAMFAESFKPEEIITNLEAYPAKRQAVIPVYATDSIDDNGRRKPGFTVKQATEERSFREVYELLGESGFSLPEFEQYYKSALSLSKNGGGVFIIENNGHVVSTASVMGQDSRQGLIGAVATSPGMRGKGLGGHVVGDAAKIILNRGLDAVICCLSEKAGRVYERIGFRQASLLFKFK